MSTEFEQNNKRIGRIQAIQEKAQKKKEEKEQEKWKNRKLYVILQRNSASGIESGFSTDVYTIKGIFKNKKNAQEVINRPFGSQYYIHNAVMTEIETDLFIE